MKTLKFFQSLISILTLIAIVIIPVCLCAMIWMDDRIFLLKVIGTCVLAIIFFYFFLEVIKRTIIDIKEKEPAS